MQPKLTIQERLKDLRVERGLTLEQLSAETGISKSALGKYEADDFKDISPFSIRNWRSSTGGPPIIYWADRTKKSPKHRAGCPAFV